MHGKMRNEYKLVFQVKINMENGRLDSLTFAHGYKILRYCRQEQSAEWWEFASPGLQHASCSIKTLRLP
jgi:hypothetical protein